MVAHAWLSFQPSSAPPLGTRHDTFKGRERGEGNRQPSKNHPCWWLHSISLRCMSDKSDSTLGLHTGTGGAAVGDCREAVLLLVQAFNAVVPVVAVAFLVQGVPVREEPLVGWSHVQRGAAYEKWRHLTPRTGFPRYSHCTGHTYCGS